MSLTTGTRGAARQDAAIRWGMCALAVIALHAWIAVLLLRTVPPFEVPTAPPEAVLLDLPPEPEAAEPQQATPPDAALAPPPAEPQVDAAPIPAPPPQAPEPQPQERAVEPVPPVPALPIVPDAKMVLPPLPPLAMTILPPPRAPVTRPAPRLHLAPPRPPPPAPPPSSAQPSPAQAAVAPAAVAAAPAPNANALPIWRSELISRLQRSKRYPDAARSQGDQGVAVVTFTMDRSGRVLTAVLARSSGVAALDDEAIAMLHRAEPLPPMPAEMPAPSITLTVPVSFALR